MKIKYFILLFVFAVAARADIVMQPYLMGVQANSVWVLVECSNTDSCSVEFGSTPGLGMKAGTKFISETTSGTFVHKIQLEGLEQNTVYYYSAHQQISVSEIFSFITAPASDSFPFRFVWIGDYRSGPDIHGQICLQVPQYSPRFYLNGGDVAITGDYDDFKREYFIPNELFLISGIPFFLTPGNHEKWSTNTRAFTKSVYTDTLDDGYYSFDYGNMHVLVLNNMTDYSPGSPQYNFAMADLAASAKTWKIVMSHKPAYCWGGHFQDTNMIYMTQDIFERAGVDMVISGHSHFYQHNRVNGIEHMVIGGGGAPLYNPRDTIYTIKSVKDYNFAIVDVNPENFVLSVYNNLNLPLDTVRMDKNTNVSARKRNMSADFSLDDVYLREAPNVFTVNYRIKTKDEYSLQMFDITGNVVKVIQSGVLPVGEYGQNIYCTGIPEGIYYVMLRHGKDFDAEKIIIQ